MPLRLQTVTVSLAAGLLTGASALAGAPGATVYATDFESGSTSGIWSVDVVSQTVGLTRFLGRFGNSSATMSIALKAGVQHELSFDFIAIDSWDGSDTPWGPDYFGVRIGGVEVFKETFSGFNGPQTYHSRPDRVGEFGFGWWNDSVFHISMLFTSQSANTTIQFFAQGLEPMTNESWGLDNVSVRELATVPAPGGAALLGAAGAMGLRRRRR